MIQIDGSMRRREQRLGLGGDLTKSSRRNNKGGKKKYKGERKSTVRPSIR